MSNQHKSHPHPCIYAPCRAHSSRTRMDTSNLVANKIAYKNKLCLIKIRKLCIYNSVKRCIRVGAEGARITVGWRLLLCCKRNDIKTNCNFVYEHILNSPQNRYITQNIFFGYLVSSSTQLYNNVRQYNLIYILLDHLQSIYAESRRTKYKQKIHFLANNDNWMQQLVVNVIICNT